uniref:MTTase N-terminal domain-containing protein n=1 Tax=Salmo trutta TaxID=8032 RepID=A0A674AKP4_SALTR
LPFETFIKDIVIMSSTCDSLIDDIEDMVSADDPTPQERQYARKSIIPRARKRNTQQTTEVLHADSVIPGMQKIWMRTWGCSHNNSDGEYMAGQLAASGYKMTGRNHVMVTR